MMRCARTLLATGDRPRCSRHSGTRSPCSSDPSSCGGVVFLRSQLPRRRRVTALPAPAAASSSCAPISRGGAMFVRSQLLRRRRVPAFPAPAAPGHFRPRPVTTSNHGNRLTRGFQTAEQKKLTGYVGFDQRPPKPDHEQAGNLYRV